MHLEDGIPIGRFEAANRIFMAPCTRHRATIDEVPTPRMVKYYADRASAGLIISEGISPEPRGRGYYFTPGAYNDAQQDGWVPIARAVHARGGRIFGQIMHCGRISDPALQPDGALPIAPSAVQPDPNFRGYTMACPRPKRHHFTPRALETEEIPRLVDSFADAARRLVAAGFDGVELHGASGYLPMQFLSSSSNRREDAYGGDVAGRARFVLDIIDAMGGAIGNDRVAIKLAPAFRFHDVHDDDPVSLYSYVAKMLSNRGLAYVQASSYGDYCSYSHFDPIGLVRANYEGVLVANGGFSRESAEQAIQDGKADAVAFGTAFIANPDLPERFKQTQLLNVHDPETFYTQGDAGYNDYPKLGEAADPARLAGYEGTQAADLESYRRGTRVPSRTTIPTEY